MKSRAPRLVVLIACALAVITSAPFVLHANRADLAAVDSTGALFNRQLETESPYAGEQVLLTAAGPLSRQTSDAAVTGGFTATSRANGNWNADATWSITRPGQITCPGTPSRICTGNGSSGQDFISDLSVSNVITLTADNAVIGTIASIDSATQITLAAIPTKRTDITFKARRAPAATDAAVIEHTVTVTAPASVETVDNSRRLIVSSGMSLSVAGSVSVRGRGTAALTTVHGNLSAGRLAIEGGGNGSGTATVTLVGPSASMTVTGPTTLTANNSSTYLDVGPGRVSVGSLSIDSSQSGNVSEVKIGIGTLTNLGSTWFAGSGSATRAKLTFTSVGGGTFDEKADFGSGGALTMVAGSTITFTGASPSSIGFYTTYENMTIDKTGGAAATLAGSTTVNGLLTVTAGTLAGNGAITLTLGGGGVSNAGTVSLDGSSAGCGSEDTLLLRSTMPGTARSWSGAGTFNIQDVSVQDQNGPTTASSSTLVSNSNWIVSATCTTTPNSIVSSSVPSSPLVG